MKAVESRNNRSQGPVPGRGRIIGAMRALTCVPVFLACVALQLGAHAPPGVGQGQNRRQAPYPALQRPPGDPELIGRGQALYGINCRSCHGVDLRGGELEGPNLLRSQLVLRDEQGELIGPVILEGRSSPGVGEMPPQALSENDVRAVVAYIHDILSTASRQGGPPPGEEVELDILVGDATAGQAYFAARCTSCHSPTGDLEGIGARIPDAQELQNTWVRGAVRGADRPPVTVTVTPPSGERVEGRLERLSDFLVVLTDAGGRHRSFARRGETPRVEVDDPMAVHRELLLVYSDTDIHNVTAYLATLQ